MNKLLLRYHLEIYSIVVVLLAMYGVFNWESLAVPQQIVVIMMVIGLFHEWEEKRWPGGFFEAVGKAWGWGVERVDMRAPGQWVVYAWLVITVVPFVLPRIPGLALAPVFLGIFEAFIHTAGGRITRTKGWYFPGLITGWVMAAASVYCLGLVGTSGAFAWHDYLIGLLFIAAVFIALQYLIQRSANHSIGKMMRAMRSRGQRQESPTY